jgi:hypothetical protein
VSCAAGWTGLEVRTLTESFSTIGNVVDDDKRPTAGGRPIEPLDVAATQQVRTPVAGRSETPVADRAAKPSRVAADGDRGLGDRHRVARPIEVAVVSEIAVIELAIDLERRAPDRAGTPESTPLVALVIGSSPIWAGEDLVCPRHRLESPIGLRIGAGRVRVGRSGQPSIRRADLGLSRNGRESERGVVVGAYRRWSPALAGRISGC